MIDKRVLLIANIPSPYRIPLFNRLAEQLKHFKILFMDYTESNREWENKLELDCDYTVLKKSAFGKFMEKRIKKVQFHWNKDCFKEIHQFKPDVIISGAGYTCKLNIVGYLYSVLFSKDLIPTEAMNYNYYHEVSIVSKALRRFVYKKSKSFVAYSETSKKFLESFGIQPYRIFVGPNTVDISKFKAARKEKNLFIYVGRLSSEKNVLFMLRAFRQDFDNDYKLMLIGSGPDEEEIRSFISKNKLSDNIVLSGFIEYDKIQRCYEKADYLILPSIKEPWGLVYNEAVGSLTIPIISEYCGCSELVEDGVNGFKFNPEDVNNFMLLIKKMVDGEIDKRRIRSNLESLRKRLTINHYAMAFEKAIKSMN